MIKSFKHIGLERFFLSGNQSGIPVAHAGRIRDRLVFLHAANSIEDVDKPGYRLRRLAGEQKQQWSVTMSRSWRIVFEFNHGVAYFVNYEDYH